MTKKINYKKISLEELAGIISEKLSQAGIDSTLVGGACVSIYSKNKYQSYDLDYVIYDDMKIVAKVLNELNFIKKGKYFEHIECQYFIEFVSPPVSIGNEPVQHFELHHTKLGIVKMLTPTDCVKDRLASFYHWDDIQALDQAILVYKSKKKNIDIEKIKRWSKKEGQFKKFETFFKKL